MGLVDLSARAGGTTVGTGGISQNFCRSRLGKLVRFSVGVEGISQTFCGVGGISWTLSVGAGGTSQTFCRIGQVF